MVWNIWQDPIPCVLDFWWAKSSFYTCWIIIAVPGTPPEFEAPYVNTSYIIYLYPSSCWLSCPCQKSTSCQVAKPLILICKVLDIFYFTKMTSWVFGRSWKWMMKEKYVSPVQISFAKLFVDKTLIRCKLKDFFSNLFIHGGWSLMTVTDHLPLLYSL